ncbi:MAG: hemolysin family protein [Tepidisphaeraceae bacterium]|jgi:CBS domain containing-hemolysin-like protein
MLLIGLGLASLFALAFSILTYALRNYSQGRLEDCLARRNRPDLLIIIADNQNEFIFITAVFRMLATIFIVVCAIRLAGISGGIIIATLVSLVFSIALPTAIAQHAGEPILALAAPATNGLRRGLRPLTAIMHLSERLVRQVLGGSGEPEPEQMEKDILSVVEAGEKEGVVDTAERRMIESVIEFRNQEVAQNMTARPEVKAIEVTAGLDDVRQIFEETGHSRLPVYDGTLDHVVGILHARDLLKQVGLPAGNFDMRQIMRPALFVPETKPLKELLVEFRMQKVHIAIVLDEYGGTAGVVTIEDILEELVGEISDEHEPQEKATLRKLGPNTYDIDARLFIDELNKSLKLRIPEDSGVDTIGGWVSNQLGRIPTRGTVFEYAGVRFEVTDAAPQMIRRLKIEVTARVEG